MFSTLKNWLFVYICFVITISFGHGQESKRLLISYYYEALCPDCMEFDKTQLFPLYSKIPEYLDLDLVPYGNAERKVNENGTVDIRCQHGPDECWTNKLHACSISKLERKIANEFVGCTMSQKRPSKAGLYCAKVLNISKKYSELRGCAESTEGNELLNKNGIRTEELNPPHTFVPWVIFNGVYSKKDMDDCMENLVAVVCRLLTGDLPPLCNQV